MKLASRLLTVTTLTAAILSVATFAHAAPRAEGAAKRSARAFPGLTLIYRFTGLVTTSQAAFTGVQVAALCTNWSGSRRTIQFVFRDWNATVVSQGTFNLDSINSMTVVTQYTNLYAEDGVLTPTSNLNQGSLQILATGPEVQCSAQLVDAASYDTVGIVTLAPVRFNEFPGAQE